MMETQVLAGHIGNLLRTIRAEVKQGIAEGEALDIIKENAIQSDEALSAYEELVSMFIDINIDDWVYEIQTDIKEAV